MFDDPAVQDVGGRATATDEVLDVGIVQRERGDLLGQVVADDELVAIPEVFVIGDHLCEGTQEVGLEEGSAVAVHDALEGPALVDELEVRPAVLDQCLLADVVHDLLKTTSDLVYARASTRTEVAVQHGNHLDEGDCGDEIGTALVLAPRDGMAQREAALFCQTVECLHGRDLSAQVAQGDVARQLRLPQVEILEHGQLICIAGVEVDGRTEVWPEADGDLDLEALHDVFGRHADQPHGGRRPLKSVDHEGGVLQEHIAFTLEELFSAHAEHDVWDLSLAQCLHEGFDLLVGENLALVIVGLDQLEAERIDDSTQDDIAEWRFVKRCVQHLDVGGPGGHGKVSLL